MQRTEAQDAEDARREGRRGKDMKDRERVDLVVGAKGKSNRGSRICQNFHITGPLSLGMPLLLGGTLPQAPGWPWPCGRRRGYLLDWVCVMSPLLAAVQ